MTTLTIEILLAVALVFVLMNFFKKKSQPEKPAFPPPDLANLKPGDAQPGDAVSISGAGDEFSDLDFTVDRAVRIQAGSRWWIEVSGPYKERRVSMRVASDADGDAQVYIHTDPRKLTIEDFGLTEADLGDMDERQNTSDWFEFESRSWFYRLSREAQATSGAGGPSSFYYWEFQEKDGKGLLAIRKPEGEPFSATQYTAVPAGNVTVYRGARA
jgi:hypothetical protein